MSSKLVREHLAQQQEQLLQQLDRDDRRADERSSRQKASKQPTKKRARSEPVASASHKLLRTDLQDASEQRRAASDKDRRRAERESFQRRCDAFAQDSARDFRESNVAVASAQSNVAARTEVRARRVLAKLAREDRSRKSAALAARVRRPSRPYTVFI